MSWARKRVRSLTSSVAFRTIEVFKKKTKDKDDDDDDDAPVAKHTASKTRNMYPPVYASVVETTVLPMFSFLFETEFNYTSSGYYICRNPFWNAAERTPRKVTKSACVFIMMMSFSSFELEKLDLIRDTERQKERGILSNSRERERLLFTISSFDQGRNKGNTTRR